MNKEQILEKLSVLENEAKELAGAEWQKQQDNSAIGFAEWISGIFVRVHYLNKECKWCDTHVAEYGGLEDDYFTTKELYNIYLKSKGLAPVEDNNAIQRAIEFCEQSINSFDKVSTGNSYTASRFSGKADAYNDMKQFLENLNTK